MEGSIQTYFKVLSFHFPRGAEENHENLSQYQPISGPKIKPPEYETSSD
jgi:hypothetical protein